MWKRKRELKQNITSQNKIEIPVKTDLFLFRTRKHLFYSHLTQFNPTSTIVHGPDNELSEYIEKIKREEITEKIFQFWSDHRKTYESLSPLALDLLAAPASQAYTERQ